MSNLSAASCCDDNRSGGFGDISPIFLILILCLCGGNNGSGGLFSKDKCDGGNNGIEGILPILLILCLCGGSF
jgi:hypothetical protein